MTGLLVQSTGLPDRDKLSSFELLGYYANASVLEVALQQDTRSVLPNFLMFTSVGEGFLVSIDSINSVIREEPVIKPLPFAPAWFRGLSSIRNEIVSVISFSVLWGAKKTAGDHKKKHYILLGGEMDGYMIEVDELIGIRSLDVRDVEMNKRFIDGHALSNGITWQRINIDALFETELQNKMEFQGKN